MGYYQNLYEKQILFKNFFDFKSSKHINKIFHFRFIYNYI